VVIRKHLADKQNILFFPVDTRSPGEAAGSGGFLFFLETVPVVRIDGQTIFGIDSAAPAVKSKQQHPAIFIFFANLWYQAHHVLVSR